MTITAKYPGTCLRCGQPFKAGDKIEWEKGKGSFHSECPAKAKAQPAVATDPKLRVARGSGTGGVDYEVGQIIKTRDGKWGVVVKTSRRYFREDGLSFGVGDDRGYVYSAECRAATEVEIAAEEQRRAGIQAQRDAKSAAAARLNEIKKLVHTGERPEGINTPEGERLLDSQDIYGGGDWFVLGAEWLWHCVNNGRDGDDWQNNNVRTGGAGAIGWRIPIAGNESLIAELREYVR